MHRWGRLIGLLAAMSLVVGIAMPALLAPAGSAAAGADPPLTVPAAALGASFGCANPSFPNAATHEPVLLVHGTYSTARENWGSTYLPALARDHFDACWVNLPSRALVDIQVSTEYVVYAVHQMFAMDGGRPVAMIGHSQGAEEVRWALRWWPSVQSEVADAITLAGPNHGTTIADGANPCFPSCWQMKTTSKFIAALNSVTETPGQVSYTALFSDYDTLVVPERPNSTAAINGPGASNIRTQDVCPGRPVDHISFAFDGMVYRLVLDALTHPGPADVARTLRDSGGQLGLCTQFDLGDSGASMAVLGQELANGRFASAPGVSSEPPLASYAR